MRNEGFEAVRVAFSESLLWRMLQAAGEAWTAALEESRTARALRRLAAGVGRWPAADRLQAAALALAGFGIGNLGLRPLTPVYVASTVPTWLWAAEVVAALVVAAGARHFAAAWPRSTVARWARGRVESR